MGSEHGDKVKYSASVCVYLRVKENTHQARFELQMEKK